MEGGGKDKRIIVLVDLHHHEALNSLKAACKHGRGHIVSCPPRARLPARVGSGDETIGAIGLGLGALVGGAHDESSEGVKI